MEIKFYYNGIKVDKSKLILGHFSFQETWTTGTGKVIPTQVTFYVRGYRTSAVLRAAFIVQNDSDSREDYFEEDRVRFVEGSMYYEAALKAANDRAARHKRKAA